MNYANSHFKFVYAKLRLQGITVDPSSLKKSPVQGAGSEVFIVKSDRGALILHAGQIGAGEHQRKPWKKVALVSKFLKNFPMIPSASVILSIRRGQEYFIVQHLLPGQSPGKRIEQGNVVDVWNTWSNDLEKDIERTIAHIHQIPVSGGGWLVERTGRAIGKYKTWQEFLEKEIPHWLKNVRKSEGSAFLTTKIKKHYQKNKKKFIVKESFLVHGDLINPSNMLILGNKVTGIIDWEFALAGDPAWEFCFNNRYSLDTYFRSFKNKFSAEQKIDFRERIKLYEPLFLARVLSFMDKKEPAYAAYRSHLERLQF